MLVYFEDALNALEDGHSKLKTNNMLEFIKSNTRFLVLEKIYPRDV